MEIGDLVCYNAAGQKYKTLGLVLEIKEDSPRELQYQMLQAILIQWCVVGLLMPRRHQPVFLTGYQTMWDKPIPGEIVWHQLGNWFEVSK